MRMQKCACQPAEASCLNAAGEDTLLRLLTVVVGSRSILLHHLQGCLCLWMLPLLCRSAGPAAVCMLPLTQLLRCLLLSGHADRPTNGPHEDACLLGDVHALELGQHLPDLSNHLMLVLVLMLVGGGLSQSGPCLLSLDVLDPVTSEQQCFQRRTAPRESLMHSPEAAAPAWP